MKKYLLHIAIFAVLVITGCGQGGPDPETAVTSTDDTGLQLEREPVPNLPPPVELAARTRDGVKLLAQLSYQVGEDRDLDFGSVPAGEFMPNMKFMSPLYTSLLLLQNNTGDPLVVQSVGFENVISDEAESPFSTCGIEFNPFTLASGKSLAIGICFHPATISLSTATAQIFDDAGTEVAAISVRGSGRLLAEGEFPPMGLIAPDPTPDLGGAGNVQLKNGRLIEVLTGNDLTPKLKDDPLLRGKEKPSCIVKITGGGEIPNPAVSAQYPGSTAINTGNIGIDEGVAGDEINVGEHVILDILINCPDGTSPVPTAVLWTISGDHIKDYNEEIRSGTVVEIPMTNADLAVTPRDLYWKNTGTHRVECKVDYTWNGAAITANVQRDFVVERNDSDIDRQMEDFYLWNHEAKVLKGHFSWHPANPAGFCRSTGQRDFFEFHRQFLGSANGFRSTFGYQNIRYWDGTQVLPVSPDSLHANRNPRNIPFPIPSWYTRFGAGVASPCLRVEKLGDFATAGLLAKEMEGAWHGRGHVNVGGTMRSWNSPKDPIFFRWHMAIDTVYYNWRRITGQP